MAKKKSVKIIVAGAAGRMGCAILSVALRDPRIQVVGAFEQASHPSIGRDVGELLGQAPINVPLHPDIRECIKAGGVIIDFTNPLSTQQNLEVAVKAKRAMVIGTTGLDGQFIHKLQLASRNIAIVQSPNMSAGVNLLFKLAYLVGEVLDDRYDVEIVEEHHRHKKDAPSGTALELARLIAKARKVNFDQSALYGRQGFSGERKRGAIGIHAVRGGDVVGNHQVSFLSEGERVELIHKASSREAFAFGAILAAKFVAARKSGFYNMQQVLGL
jgi:4-hydroxy-tetrahydrodipicolinate reductase